jgi:hypothetical protein
LQNRFVIGHAGIKKIDITDARTKKPVVIPYSYSRLITELRREVSPMFTIARVAELMRDKLVQEFRGFDALPQSGSFQPEYLEPPTHRVITEFNLAGYDGSNAHIYSVGGEMDWQASAHRVPPVEALYPERIPRKYLSVFVSGHSDAILSLYNRASPGARQFASKYPTEYSALGNERDLDIPGMVILARALLAVQITQSPVDVGYPLQVVVIPNRGTNTAQTYHQ